MKKREAKKEFTHGLKMGVPIGIGYFVVAFSLGINAKVAGFTTIQAGLASMLLMASAGEYALFTLVAAGASYVEIAVMELVANARYLLMSCALSQKLHPETKFFQRFFIGQSITDEMFGAAIGRDKFCTAVFYFGMMAVSIPGWTIGTMLGVAVGNILPANIVTALSVGLYGMFIAIVVPPSKKSRIVFCVVLVSAALSTLFAFAPLLSKLSEGIRTIILTIIISAGAALLFPVDDDGNIIAEKKKEVANEQ
ncbi:MAG: AzlC family ABC transporter permease [Lachnospiraceae bacterium]|nr:AzlC family ABC transporter permease [Lachnospiraceae bacterium]